MRLTPFLVGIGFALTSATVSWAETLTSEHRTALEARVAAFEVEVAEVDLAGMMTFLPPSMLQKLAERAGMKTNQLLRAVEAQSKQTMQFLENQEVPFDLGYDDATSGVTELGRPYAVMLSQVDMVGIGSSQSPTIALMESGVWYFVRLETPDSIRFFHDIFPDMTGVTIPKGTYDLAD